MKLDGKTNAELVEMQNVIETLPENKMPSGSLWLYTPSARKKLDKISRKITDNLRIARRLTANPVNTSGYSGRQTNRR